MRFLRLALFALGCWGVMVAAVVVWHGGLTDQPNTYQPAEVEATVDDVYAALSSQMGGATPDYETQVKPILEMHLTYSELQEYVQTDHSPMPTRVPAPTATATAAARTSIPTAPPTAATSYFYANWNCGTSTQCASVMGTATGSAGPFCSKPPCDKWRQTYFAGATCETAARYHIYRGPTPPSPCQA